MVPTVLDNLTAAGSGPFVLLAGAGVSLWHPSSLPTWNEFNTALLDEAKARAARALPAQSPLRNDLDRLTVDAVGSKAFSNALVEILAGQLYFDVVVGLNVTEPNAVHRGIARLVRQRVITAVVTTNFDTLTEQALNDERVKFDVYFRGRDYERRSDARCPVLKIHGSAIPDSPLIDTVGQKLRGLAPVVRDRLRELFAQHSVLVLGYSGGDLEFGADYLTLRCVPPGGARLWWVVRPEDIDKVEGPAREIVADRGAFVRMSQAQALEAVGAGPVNAQWNDETRAVRLNDLRRSARTLFTKLGSVNTLAFCMRLLSSAGHSGAAASMWTHIASVVDKRKRQTVAVLGPAMRALASEGHRLFGVEAQETWACRQLKDIHLRRDGRPGSYRDEDALIRDVRSEALALLAIGDSKVRRGQDEAAGLAMQRAMEACEYVGDITLLPGVYRLYGWRDVVRFRQGLEASLPLRNASEEMVADLVRLEQRGLNYLMAAEAAGLVGGNVDAIESAWIRADLLTDLGEYDAALLCLERLRERVGLGVHRETRVRIECVLGEIDLRQGRPADAMRRWNRCLADLAHGNPMLEAYVQHVIIGRIGYAPEWRETVIGLCHDVLAKMDRGDLPVDGRSDLIGARGYFETVRTNLTTLGAAPIAPGFIQALDEFTTPEEYHRWPAHYVRAALIEAEFEGDVGGVLGLLDVLVACHYQSLNGGRALDAATAHLRRARLDGDDSHRFAAEANVAAIRHWLGDRAASAWFEAAGQNPRAGSPETRSGLERRLPHALWTTGGSGARERYERDATLDLDDALALRWTAPPTGAEREQDARRRFDRNDYVLGRLMALEAIAAYREEGDPGGLSRVLQMLEAAGRHDALSGDDPLSLCS
jgi:SIR2-like protein